MIIVEVYCVSDFFFEVRQGSSPWFREILKISPYAPSLGTSVIFQYGVNKKLPKINQVSDIFKIFKEL